MLRGTCMPQKQQLHRMAAGRLVGKDQHGLAPATQAPQVLLLKPDSEPLRMLKKAAHKGNIADGRHPMQKGDCQSASRAG